MIRRIINRIRRQEPSKPVLFTPNSAPVVKGRPATRSGKSMRRGATRRPMRVVRAERRAATKRARAARRANR